MKRNLGVTRNLEKTARPWRQLRICFSTGASLVAVCPVLPYKMKAGVWNAPRDARLSLAETLAFDDHRQYELQNVFSITNIREK